MGRQINMANAGILQGIRVADFSKWLPGQYCGMLLGDYGADVIKLESLAGDGTRAFSPALAEGMSYWHLMLNRNKRGLALDIKNPAGREVLLRLLRSCDVFLEGFRPGYLARYGLGYEDVRRVNPGIIYCSITGFGQQSHQPAHDLNVVGLAGISCIDGAGRAAVSNVQFAAISSGLHALNGILAALLARSRSGEGQQLDVSLYAAALSAQVSTASNFWGCQATGGRGFGRSAHYYNNYRTRDGRYLTVGTMEPKFWRRLCALLGCEELLERQFDFAHAQEIEGILAEKIAAKTLAEWLELIGGEEFCVTPVCTLGEALASDLTQQTGMVTAAESDLGRLNYLLAPVKFSAAAAQVYRRAPKLGEHTDAILRELGYTQEEVRGLHGQGAI